MTGEALADRSRRRLQWTILPSVALLFVLFEGPLAMVRASFEAARRLGVIELQRRYPGLPGYDAEQCCF